MSAEALPPAPRSIELTRPDSVLAPIPASPDTGAAFPVEPPVPPDALRRAIHGRGVRIEVGGERFVIRRPALDATGVAFEPGHVRWSGSREPDLYGHYPPVPAPPRSPIPWNRIDRIETRARSARRVAAWGALVLPAVLMAAAASSGRDYFAGTPQGAASMLVFLGGSAAVSATTGAIVGSSVYHWKPAWQRPPAAAKRAR
jgi:hypothetical protein